MRVLVAGSGVNGGIIAARLVEKGECEITMVTRESRKAQLMTRGLQLRSQFGQFRRPIHAITVGEIGNTYDVVVIAVRAQELDSVMNLLVPAIGPQTILMPVVEGVQHLECDALTSRLHVVPAVLEARALQDADQILTQRPPAAELTIGAVHEVDRPMALDLVELFRGRGLKTIHSERIRAKAYERYAFMAAGIAASYMLGRPLRDLVRFAYGPGTFEALLREAFEVGVAAGFAPDKLKVMAYDRAFLLEGRPVQAPPRICDDGRAGDEAVYLLGEMVARARRARVNASRFGQAWRRLTKPTEIELPAADVTSGV